MKLSITLTQMNSTNSHDGNIKAVQEIVGNSGDTDLIALPECAGLMNANILQEINFLFDPENDPFIQSCKIFAKQYEKWFHIGSTPVVENNQLYNCSALINDKGEMIATYKKIHLFDALPGSEYSSRESDRYSPGNEAVLVDSPWGRLGLSICYDLRFPSLFQEYSKKFAKIVFIPSAFTPLTGRDHWELLLRARAIENNLWIIAAAQVGHHNDGRTTYGHSMIIDPNGEVITDLGGSQTCYSNHILQLQ